MGDIGQELCLELTGVVGLTGGMGKVPCFGMQLMMNAHIVPVARK